MFFIASYGDMMKVGGEHYKNGDNDDDCDYECQVDLHLCWCSKRKSMQIMRIVVVKKIINVDDDGAPLVVMVILMTKMTTIMRMMILIVNAKLTSPFVYVKV